MQRQVRFNRDSGEGSGRLGAKPSQVQKDSGEGSGEGRGGFGAESGQVQQGSGKGSRKPWCKAKSSSTGSAPKPPFGTFSGKLVEPDPAPAPVHTRAIYSGLKTPLAYAVGELPIQTTCMSTHYLVLLSCARLVSKSDGLRKNSCRRIVTECHRVVAESNPVYYSCTIPVAKSRKK